MVDSSAVKAYLTGISRRYEQWRQDNALTDTIAEGQATFTFDQFVQTEEKRQGKQPEKTPPLELFKGIRDYLDKEHVLLVGSPGVGKSSALWHCYNVLAQEELEATEPRIPVFVQLKGFTNSDDPFSIRVLIRTSVGLRLRLSDADIEDLLCDKRMILLLDGLNEMPTGASRTHLKAFRQECQELEVPLICSTRELYGGDLGIQRKLEIQPLGPGEIERFLQECLPDHQGQVRQLLQRDNRDLSRTPFVLWMLYHLLKETGTIEDTLGEAFRNFFRDHFRNYKEDVPVSEERRKDWNLWMEYLAFSMLISPDPLDPGLVISEEEAESRLIDRFGELQGQPSRIEELKKYHLLMSFSDREISFKHQLIQEYYAAECLASQIPDLYQEHSGQEYVLFQRNFLNHLKWTEVIALMLRFPEITQYEEEVLKLASEVDFLLAAKLMKSLSQDVQTKALEKIMLEILNIAPNKPSWLELRLYEEVGTEAVIDHLLPLLDHSDYRIRGRAYMLANKVAPQTIPEQSLAAKEHLRIRAIIDSIPKENEPNSNQIESSISKDILSEEGSVLNQDTLRYLNSEIYDYYRQYINKEISEDNFIRSVAPKLNDSDEQVSHSAYIVLESLNPEIRLQVFLNSVQEPDLSVTTSVVEAIGHLGGEEVIPQLINLVKQHSNPDIRCSAVTTLKFIGSDVAIPGILQGLKDTDMWVCDQAIRASEELASEEIIVELLNVISISSNSHLRRLAAHQLKVLSLRDGLSHFLSENHFSNLVDLLEDQDLWVRWYISLTIWNLGDEQGIPLLDSKLQSEDLDIGLSAALPLGRFGYTKATPSLIQIMNHENLIDHPDISGISYTAAYALGQIEGNTAAQYLPELFTLLSTSSGKNCLYAINLIQSRCGFYNYKVFGESQKLLEQENNSGHSTIELSKHEEYKRILTTLYHMVRVMERNPSTFFDIGEEALRDHFLVQLNGIYEGQATGETVNYKGKTDIMVRLKGENVFIGECKFWGGESKLIATLDQLLGYSTWHDDQLGMLIFNRNKNFSSVLKQIPEIIKHHSSFLEEENQLETEFHFIVKHPGDPERKLKLAVLAFDIPSSVS